MSETIEKNDLTIIDYNIPSERSVCSSDRSLKKLRNPKSPKDPTNLIFSMKNNNSLRISEKSFSSDGNSENPVYDMKKTGCESARYPITMLGSVRQKSSRRNENTIPSYKKEFIRTPPKFVEAKIPEDPNIVPICIRCKKIKRPIEDEFVDKPDFENMKPSRRKQLDAEYDIHINKIRKDFSEMDIPKLRHDLDLESKYYYYERLIKHITVSRSVGNWMLIKTVFDKFLEFVISKIFGDFGGWTENQLKMISHYNPMLYSMSSKNYKSSFEASRSPFSSFVYCYFFSFGFFVSLKLLDKFGGPLGGLLRFFENTIKDYFLFDNKKIGPILNDNGGPNDIDYKSFAEPIISNEKLNNYTDIGLNLVNSFLQKNSNPETQTTSKPSSGPIFTE